MSSEFINGYIYLTPNNSATDKTNSYYTALSYIGTGFPLVSLINLPAKQYPTYPLDNYAIVYKPTSSDLLNFDGTITTLQGGTIPTKDMAGYWINKDPNHQPVVPTSGTGIVYQHYANTIYIGSNGLPDIQPFGVNPVAEVTPTTGLPRGAYWVTGTIEVSKGFNWNPTPFGPDTSVSTIDIPPGSYMMANGTIVTPDGHIYKAGGYSHAKLNKVAAQAPSDIPLPTLTDPQNQQKEFLSFLEQSLGTGFQLAFGSNNPYPNFAQLLSDTITSQQRKTSGPPPAVEEWQCRIGGSLFFVPPVSINVNQTFESGSLTGAAIRQISSPKFNSGHSETTITMTLFFPGVDQIWGYKGGNISIDFQTALDQDIDIFLASLRGLIAQFRYTPFVPIVNQYLNSVWNITSVAFRGMNLSTVPGYPFLIRCDLELVRFNHQVYLPMVAALDDAIDWDRFRQYVGRAAVQMDEQANQAFALQTLITSPTQGASAYQPSTGGKGNIDNSGSPADITGTDTVLNSSIALDIASANYGTKNTNASTIEFFFPTHDPAEYLGPSYNQTLYGFDQSTTANSTQGLSPDQWQGILKAFGMGVDSSQSNNGYIPFGGKDLPDLQQIQNIDTSSISADISYVQQYFKTFNNILGALSDTSAFNKYKAQALQQQYGNPQPGTNAYLHALQNIQGAWYWNVWQQLTTNNNFLDSIFAMQDYLRGNIQIDEWDVPMAQLPLDSNFIVEQVRVNIGNNLARLQLHMLDQPAYQHIGGLDTNISITATCIGEANLTKIRTMFDTINSLARLEHSHAVLGFLGVRNLIVALAGTRYVIPKSYDVETIPGYPHVYRVNLSFLDFDVFQQKREMLSTQQEKQFTDLMGKRNPFLRLQQVWTAFSAYSDFPLAVRDPKTNSIVGYLDPDYYFKAFKTIDDDIIQNFAATPNYTPSAYIAQPAITGGPPPSNIVLAADVTTNGGSSNSQTTQLPPQPIGSSLNRDYQMLWHFGPLSQTGNHQSIGITGGGGMDMRTGNDIYIQNATFNEAHVGNTQQDPIVQPTPGQPYFATPASGYVFPNFTLNQPSTQTAVNSGTAKSVPLPYANTNSGSSMGNFQGILHDLQYRDVSGRMIRAFPTYMLWFIDEGGLFAGIQLFGDFYGLQSVLDFSHVANQDVLGDTLVIRISNLYSRLSTKYQEQVDPAIFPGIATLINPALNIVREFATGLNPFAVANLATINLKPGARLHLRVGYGSNVNLLDTIFNGVITEVQQGDILTITAQSDSVELGAMVNTTNPNGSSGHIDGSMTSGFYLSDPRDLIVRLLSMGNSNWEEMISYATRGMLFSQNRFGIRHFGSVLYDAVSDRELNLQNGFMSKLGSITNMVNNWLSNNQDIAGGGGSVGFSVGTGIINPQIGAIAMQLWANLNSHRNYEVFKRNVYPGNGLGIANYMGGDLGDGGTYTAFQSPGVNAQGQWNTAPSSTLNQLKQNIQAATGQTSQAPAVPHKSNNNAALIGTADALLNFSNPISGGLFLQQTGALHPIWTALGLTPTVTDDVPGRSAFLIGTYGPFAEVSFRAETYQRTVWDLFQTCAKLLPNYIVAVRPFMERSTVFYGKPHWAWTSGIIPITYGPDAGSKPSMPAVDKSIQNSVNKIIDLQNAFNQATKRPADVFQQIQEVINNTQKSAGTSSSISNSPTNGSTADSPQTTGGDPNSQATQFATVSIVNGGQTTSTVEISQLSLTASTGASIPVRSGPTGLEMHIPTSSSLQTDIQQHKQLASLPAQFQHPFYMARTTSGSAAGGYVRDNTYNPAVPWNQQTELSTDNPTDPGQPGAFGVLSPEAEQYYISMAWNHGSGSYPSAWVGTRILVYNPDTKLGCICTPGDYGPASFTNRVSGVAPDAWEALGRPAENAVLWYGFLDSSSTLGPVQWQTGMTFQGQQLPTASNPITLTLLNTDHTNSGSTASSGTVVLTAAANPGAPSADLPSVIPTLPPELGATVGNGQTVLDLARKVYGSSKNDSDAINIFNQFKQDFATQLVASPTSSDLYKVFTGQQKVTGTDLKGVPIQPYTTSNTHTSTQIFQQDFVKVAGDFYNWVINSPYIIGWIILTAAVKFTGAEEAAGIIGSYAGLPFAIVDNLAQGLESGFGLSNDSILGQIAQFNPIQAVTNDVFSWFHSGPSNAMDGWDFTMTDHLFAVWMTLGPGSDTGNPSDAKTSVGGAIEWMLSNATPGKTSYQIFGGTIVDLGQHIGGFIRGIINDVGDIAKFVSVAFSAISDIVRFSMALLNMGVSLSGFSGQQANLLNAVLNDSYYYDPQLGVGSLLWQVDNAYTREYGEPVIEIREPFQRVHYINSYQHILGNGLIETMNNVYTIVTASANGKSPHTAWFDKGAPAQYQYEKVVDTGLYLDSPSWYSALLHPSEVIRDFIKHVNNSDDGTEASRFARAELQRSLKNIYAGEIMILGDASIRPFDLIYISDSYERIYGLCEVQQVVHHFTPETGFVTAITPAAIVTVNDPEKWEAGSILQRQLAIQDLRNQIRMHAGIINNASGAQGFSNNIDINALVQQEEAALQGSQQFSGGATAILKDVAGSASLGSLSGKVAAAGAIGYGTGGELGLAVIGAGLFAGWEAFKWIRDNLLDAHGCYIQYLNRNGSPMDAGLSYDQGVAVGQMHVYTGLEAALGIVIPYSIGGQPNVTTSNLLQNIGWNTQDINNLKSDLNLWTAQQRSQIAGFYDPNNRDTPISNTSIIAEIKVTGVIDATTLEVSVLDGPASLSGLHRFRLQYLTSAVDPTTTNSVALALFNPLTSQSAEGYLNSLFKSGTNAATNQTCYIRLDPTQQTVKGDPSTMLGVLFYNVAPATVAPPPTALQPTNLTDPRLQALQAYAQQYPPIGWQDVQHDGSTFTLNWEMVVTNHATIDATLLMPTGQGAATSILNFQSSIGR